MFWIYALFLILLLVVLLLFLPTNLSIKYNDAFFIEIQFLFLKFKIDENSRTKKRKNKDNEYGYLKDLFKEKGIIGTVKFFWNILKISRGLFRIIVQNTKVKKLELKIRVGSEDAAEAATKYAQICGIIYPFSAFILDFNPPTKYDISVIPDFLSEKTNFYFLLRVKTKIFDIIYIGLKLINEHGQLIWR